MTYNFDPDKWYQNELSAIRAEVKAGKLTQKQYERGVAALDKRYEEMWTRLDGSYQITRKSESKG